ncbi:hypothetical protein CG709_03365, partial [Lachnotalea glycerini]
MEFEIIVDQTEKRFKKTYKSGIKYWIKHDRMIGKTLLNIVNIASALLVLISIILFILDPHNYIVPLKFLVCAVLYFFITPVLFKYLIYAIH